MANNVFGKPKAEVPVEVNVGGKPVQCGHCHNTSFFKGKAKLNTTFMTMAGLDWLNRSATVLACGKCGSLSWFKQVDPA